MTERKDLKPPMSVSHRLADQHEADLADALGARRTRGSGNQWSGPMDAREHHLDTTFAFAVDCKCTRGNSIGVSRTMWAKAVDQAGAERPMLALRYYDSDRGQVGLDLVAISLDDFLELRDRANLDTRRRNGP